ncbi:helix-turn-helix domain-containing protein [Pontibacter chinhatensis]|uniref:DNA binding domain-containing protein, excisionase family n=1 Tax=Pontibacter chinhatensis TaxID=1436961 RepID=A0A1I2ZV36_9BACT|nr:helix-turn-helix domain-containing protein [Pontibacter chinhatensis]SFH41772.1 DNA binding domain-containing protein, excisionase family [Pontibacter chinhatensis]
MNKKELYTELLENYNLQKTEAIAYLNYRVGVAVDKEKILDKLSNNIDKLAILCADLKLEIRLHENNPLVITGIKQFYSTKQAAEILNISPSKLRQLIDEGKLTVKKINQRNWQLPTWSLEAYRNDLTQLVVADATEEEVLDIFGKEAELLVSLISSSGIRTVHELQKSVMRKIANVWDNITNEVVD